MSSCTFKKGGARNEIQNGHYQLYSHPAAVEIEEIDPDIKRIVIISTNDLYGHVEEQAEQMFSQIRNQSIPYFTGGAAYFSSYLKILRSKYPDEVLLLDSGNALQGTLLANSFNAEPILKVYEYFDYDALIFGNNDFSFSTDSSNQNKEKKLNIISQLKQRLKSTSLTFLVSNLYDISTAKTLDIPKAKENIIKEVNGIKVGLIGVTSKNLLARHPKEILTGLYIDELKKNIIQNAHVLRKRGAQVIVLLAHAQLRCGLKLMQEKNLSKYKVNFVPSDSNHCKNEDELSELLWSLPNKTVDAVIVGGEPNKIANFVNGIPVMQNFGFGKYFSRMELYFNKKKNRIIHEKTNIYQPTAICHNFFRDTQDCYSQDNSVDHDNIIGAQFLGVPIEKDTQLEKILSSYAQKIHKLSDKKITNLPENFTHSYDFNSPFASFVVDIITKNLKAQIGIVYSNTIKLGLERGILTYGQLFKALPFENNLMKVQIKGSELKELIKLSFETKPLLKAYFSGINIVIATKEGRDNELNHNEPWKKEKDILIFLEDGSGIEDEKYYELATIDYIGENIDFSLGKVLNRIHHKNKEMIEVNYRDLIANELEKQTSFESVIDKYNKTKRVIFQTH